MFSQVMMWLLKSKGAKIGAGALGSGGVLILILALHSDVTARITAEKIDRKEYVNLVLMPVQTQITNLKNDIKETKSMVRDIHNYLLNKK